MTNINKCTLSVQSNVLDALKKLNSSSSLTLFVVDEAESVIGTVTDGDIRRALISGATLDSPIGDICICQFEAIRGGDFSPDDLSRIRRKNIHVVPVLDAENRIERLIDLREVKTILPVDAVIMAGGRGERLRPLTDTTPKPLLPLGNKVIMEYNVDNIASMGIDNVTVCIRYLGEQIQAYFGDGAAKGLRMRYVTEDKPLGTLGAITRIDHFEHDVVLVMNSDLFTDINLEEFYLHFLQSGADMSVAATPYNISVPYAVMKTDKDRVTSFEEKPTYTYYSNAGIYMIRRSLLETMTRDERCDTTDLMDRLLAGGGKLTYFPIVGYWLDIGTPEEYRKAKDIIKYIKHFS